MINLWCVNVGHSVDSIKNVSFVRQGQQQPVVYIQKQGANWRTRRQDKCLNTIWWSFNSSAALCCYIVVILFSEHFLSLHG